MVCGLPGYGMTGQVGSLKGVHMPRCPGKGQCLLFDSGVRPVEIGSTQLGHALLWRDSMTILCNLLADGVVSL